MSPEHSDGGLRDVVHGDELDVERPDPVVLSGRQSSECTVKHPSGPRHLALLGKELAVVNPDLCRTHEYVALWE